MKRALLSMLAVIPLLLLVLLAGCAAVPQRALRSVVALYAHGQLIGSGVVMSPRGYILTNAHVVARKTAYSVSIYGEQDSWDAEVLYAEDALDLAVLKIEVSGLTPAIFGDSARLRAGQTAYAVGHSDGEPWTVSRGIVSACRRNEQGVHTVQTDAVILPGNSGGPLLDRYFRVIGIIQMIRIERLLGQPPSPFGVTVLPKGIAYAIDGNVAHAFAEGVMAVDREMDRKD